MPIWEPIELPASEELLAAADGRGVQLPRDFYTEFDTNETAEREAFFLWLSDPIPCFVGTWRDDFEAADGVAGDTASELDGLTLEGVGRDWKTVTTLRNHHRRLNPRINMARATVSYEEETVYVNVDKQLDSGQPGGGR